MAANLDRAETSLTAVSDIAYIRGIDSSGNSVRISKADLASVLGGIINKITPSSLSVDQLITQGLYFGPIKDIPGRLSGAYAAFVEVTKLVLSTRDTFILQRIISLQNGNTQNFGVFMRCSYDNGESWSAAWNSITTNVLS